MLMLLEAAHALAGGLITAQQVAEVGEAVVLVAQRRGYVVLGQLAELEPGFGGLRQERLPAGLGRREDGDARGPGSGAGVHDRHPRRRDHGDLLALLVVVPE